MALPNPSAGDVIRASHVDEIREHLEGASGSTAPYHLRQSTGNFIITLPDAAGATKLRLNDSGGTEVFSVDSDGTITHSGTYVPATLTLPTSASPVPTVEGRVIWDSDDNNLTIGNGSSAQVFFSDDKGSDLTAATTLTPTTGHFYHVTGATTVTGISTKPAGLEVIFLFESNPDLTHNATSFILREGKSRKAVPGEIIRFISEGSGNWREVSTGTTGPKVQIVDQTVNNTTTYTSSTYLQAELAASSTYHIKATLEYKSNTTPDFKAGFTGPTGLTGALIGIGNFVSAVTVITDRGDLSTPSSTFAVSGISGGTTSDILIIEGIAHVSTTAGTLILQFAQNTMNASNTTLVAGSQLQVTKVA